MNDNLKTGAITLPKADIRRITRRPVLYILLGIATFILTLLIGMDVHAEPGTTTTPGTITAPVPVVKNSDKCVIVIGDSRTCSLNCTLFGIAPEKCYKFTEDRKNGVNNAVFKYDNIWYVISGEGGGCQSKGSYDKALLRCSQIVEEMPQLMACGSYSVVNLFAINDLYYNRKKYSTYPVSYLSKDAMLLTGYPYCDRVFQFNAGPVDPNGKAAKSGLTNELINQYNAGFVSNNLVTCVDLNTYLNNAGFTAIIDKNDNSGIHYDHDTNIKIFNLIQVMVK